MNRRLLNMSRRAERACWVALVVAAYLAARFQHAPSQAIASERRDDLPSLPAPRAVFAETEPPTKPTTAHTEDAAPSGLSDIKSLEAFSQYMRNRKEKDWKADLLKLLPESVTLPTAALGGFVFSGGGTGSWELSPTIGDTLNLSTEQVARANHELQYSINRLQAHELQNASLETGKEGDQYLLIRSDATFASSEVARLYRALAEATTESAAAYITQEAFRNSTFGRFSVMEQELSFIQEENGDGGWYLEQKFVDYSESGNRKESTLRTSKSEPYFQKRYAEMVNLLAEKR